MTLVQAWIDSLTLLKPKNFQLFVMVTLKSIIETYKLMFKYFWWLILLFEICYIPLFLSIRSVTLSFWLLQLLVFAVCAITRPSVMKKDCAYLRSQLYSFIYFAIFLLCLPATWWPTAFSAWTIFLILFFLDSEKGPKNFLLSMWYALKMILFNFPLMICIYAIMWCLNAVIFGTIEKLLIEIVKLGGMSWWALGLLHYAGLLQSTIAVLLLPIGVCTYANIYIKKLHDQFDLYFKKSQ
jgi:hypothetical protein